MAGTAITNKFMLGDASLMLGPAGSVFDLNVAAHSVGMVKNITTKSTPGFVELTQGLRNTIVDSQMNSNKVEVSAEVFEYTAKNLAYSLSLDGSTMSATAVESTITTAMALTSGVTSAILLMTVTTGFTVGDYVMVGVGANDQVFARKIVSIQASTSLTVDKGLPVALPVGTTVKKSNVVGLGSKNTNPYLSAKVAGTLSDGSSVAILFPKVRVTSGISLAFKSDNYDNIPLQLTIYDLVSTDTDYAAFLPYGNAMLLSGI